MGTMKTKAGRHETAWSHKQLKMLVTREGDKQWRR